MSCSPVFSAADKKRIAAAKKRGLSPRDLKPRPTEIGWDVRWRQTATDRPTSYRYLKQHGYTIHDAQKLDRKIAAIKAANGGRAFRHEVLEGNGLSVDAGQTLEGSIFARYVPYMAELKPSTQENYAAKIDQRILTIVPPGDRHRGKGRRTALADMPLDSISLSALTSWQDELKSAGIGKRNVELSVRDGVVDSWVRGGSGYSLAQPSTAAHAPQEGRGQAETSANQTASSGRSKGYRKDPSLDRTRSRKPRSVRFSWILWLPRPPSKPPMCCYLGRNLDEARGDQGQVLGDDRPVGRSVGPQPEVGRPLSGDLRADSERPCRAICREGLPFHGHERVFESPRTSVPSRWHL